MSGPRLAVRRTMHLRARFGTFVLAATIGVPACSAAHTAGSDAGPGADAADGVVRDCFAAGAASAGARCEPFGVCVGDGVCTSITWRCVDGRLGIERSEFCDAGTDAPAVDAGACAPATPAGGRGCRSDGDCAAGTFERCIAPGEFAGCGPCFPPMRLCASDADCAGPDGTTGFCVEYVHPCTPPFGGCGGADPTSTMCVPRCTDGSCPAGEACGSDGRCAAIPCGSLYACPLGTVCDPSAATDAHGCRRLSCVEDAECPCGSGCVEGACHGTLGACEPPRA